MTKRGSMTIRVEFSKWIRELLICRVNCKGGGIRNLSGPEQATTLPNDSSP